MINVILAEDHVIVRKAIRALIDKEKDIQIVGEAEDGNTLLELIKAVDADIILTEIEMPGLKAVDFTLLMKNKYPKMKIAFLSMHDNERDIMTTIAAGAKGFLSKSVDITELLFALRHISNDGQYICSNSTNTLLNRIRQIPDIAPIALDANLNFSIRDVEILTLMGEGHTNHEIAEKLFTSQRTVESHRQALLNKTGSRNTAALIKFSMTHHIIHA
ncbi:response regulator transcription factor [Mucilaginibacter ginkgonis]|uniref:Response regulator transcription factor n=1 Tax=Mucilaginibacter ginkgonis TaxID=2682091 RepID=A0A6I4HY57_9SPHI|nr:response regulator transcription factor [Mucilaginibacter ginkgonis]QQL51232.1 response regulator transcription factor [Mucilaginibacter ginkgonis]